MLALDLVARDRLLTFSRGNPINELLAVTFFDVRTFGGIDQHHAVLIEKPWIPLDGDAKLTRILEPELGAAIGQNVGIYRRGCIQLNPVKHGYLARAIDRSHSTIHRYVKRGMLPKDWHACQIMGTSVSDDGDVPGMSFASYGLRLLSMPAWLRGVAQGGFP